jgi:transposase
MRAKAVPANDDRSTGEVRMAEIFVAVLGASSCTYAEARSLTAGTSGCKLVF